MIISVRWSHPLWTTTLSRLLASSAVIHLRTDRDSCNAYAPEFDTRNEPVWPLRVRPVFISGRRKAAHGQATLLEPAHLPRSVAAMSHPQTAGAPSAAGVGPAAEVIAAVRASCLAVAHRPVRLAEAFYAHLFEMAPQLRAMFPPDLTGQMQKMSDTLLNAIGQLDTADTTALEAALRRLGADHRTRFGVEPEHYGYIGHALTRAVRDVAGPGYSSSLSSAWIAVYQWVATQMTAGDQAAEPGASAADRPMLALPQPRGPREDEERGTRGGGAVGAARGQRRA
jgi:hemoglobin-like flavoprotein